MAGDWTDEVDITTLDDRYSFIMDTAFMQKQFFRLIRR